MIKRNIYNSFARFLIFAYIFFISVFALDEEFLSVPFFYNLIPSFIILLLLISSFYYEITAGILLIISSVIGLMIYGLADILFSIILVFPLLISGLLFLLSGHLSKSKKNKKISKLKKKCSVRSL